MGKDKKIKKLKRKNQKYKERQNKKNIKETIEKILNYNDDRIIDCILKIYINYNLEDNEIIRIIQYIDIVKQEFPPSMFDITLETFIRRYVLAKLGYSLKEIIIMMLDIYPQIMAENYDETINNIYEIMNVALKLYKNKVEYIDRDNLISFIFYHSLNPNCEITIGKSVFQSLDEVKKLKFYDLMLEANSDAFNELQLDIQNLNFQNEIK